MSDLDRLREELKKEERSLATPQAIPDVRGYVGALPTAS